MAEFRCHTKMFHFLSFVDVRRSDGDTKAAESTKRKLSADLAVNKSHLDIKKRDGKSYLSVNSL